MSFLDKAKAKLTDAVDQHGDKIAQGIDKAGTVVNEKTGKLFTETRVEQVRESVSFFGSTAGEGGQVGFRVLVRCRGGAADRLGSRVV